jgi:hypothetical protein
MHVAYILFGIFLVCLVCRLSVTDREVIARAGLLNGWQVCNVSCANRWASKDPGDWTARRGPGGPRFYEVEYLDGEGKMVKILCRLNASRSVDWDI